MATAIRCNVCHKLFFTKKKLWEGFVINKQNKPVCIQCHQEMSKTTPSKSGEE